MGAETFETFGYGKTAQEAFSVARKDAQYEHGHGGYTGTIAEKQNFTVIDLDAEIAHTIEWLQGQRSYLTVAGQKKLQQEIAKLEKAASEANKASRWNQADRIHNKIYELKNVSVMEIQEYVGGKWVKLSMGASCRKRRQEIDAKIKILKAKRKVTREQKAEIVVDYLFGKNDRRINDKWGPAGCIQLDKVKGKRGVYQFLFFGWASS
jgi:hypothetical protein